jgi:hypothetical protein
MRLAWYQQDQERVAAALLRGERPDMATTMDSGPLDELVALHDELRVFDALDDLPIRRRRQGIEDVLLLRTLAVLPFLETSSLSGAAELLFGDPAVLLHLGWSPLQLRIGDNERRGPAAHRRLESLPCSPETLRDELARVSEADWQKVQEEPVRELFERNLIRGRVYAIDGTGLGENLRLVCLVCVSTERPVIVAWRLLTGDASEKGKEAAVARSLIEQAIRLGGEGCIKLLLADALYADGPFLAWCKYVHQIDVLVPLPVSRELHRDLEQLAAAGALSFQRHSYVRRIQGHKQRRKLDLGVAHGLTCWDSYLAAARAYGDEAPQLWGCLVRPVEPTSDDDLPWTLVSTRPWPNGAAAYQAARPRWHIENDGYRELKEGWGLEAQLWGRDADVQRGRVTLTCLAFNTAQIYLSRAGERLADKGIRRLRRHYQRLLGRTPAVIYIGRHYGVFPLEKLLDLLGRSTRTTLLPHASLANPP